MNIGASLQFSLLYSWFFWDCLVPTLLLVMMNQSPQLLFLGRLYKQHRGSLFVITRNNHKYYSFGSVVLFLYEWKPLQPYSTPAFCAWTYMPAFNTGYGLKTNMQNLIYSSLQILDTYSFKKSSLLLLSVPTHILLFDFRTSYSFYIYF